jgi:hypothetical protein
MPKKVKATGKQISMLLVHLAVFAVACVIMWSTYSKGAHGWAYPWPAWITAAWGLCLLGHYCIVFKSYDDPAYGEYRRQQGKA